MAFASKNIVNSLYEKIQVIFNLKQLPETCSIESIDACQFTMVYQHIIFPRNFGKSQPT